jgi:hypothetical protein
MPDDMHTTAHTYAAEQASYSHHERYVYRSNDVEGRQASGTDKYFHLLLVHVLRGNLLKTSCMS